MLACYCRRLGWDWIHLRPVRPHISLEAARCFRQTNGLLLENSLLLLDVCWAHFAPETMCKGNDALRKPALGARCNDALNQRHDNQRRCSLGRVLVSEQAGPSLCVSVEDLRLTVCVLTVRCCKENRPKSHYQRAAGLNIKMLCVSSICHVHRFHVLYM